MSDKLTALFHHGALKPEHITKLFTDHDGEGNYYDHEDTAVEILNHLKKDPQEGHVKAILRSGNDEAITQLAHNKNVPYEHLKHLADHGSLATKGALLYRNDTPDLDFNKIANHIIDHEDDKSDVTTLYSDARYHPDTVEKIVRHPDTEGSRRENFLSSNTKIKPETLEHFGLHGDEYEQEAVASNPKTPKHVLEKLVNHPSESVRWGVAMNSAAPKHVLMAVDHSSPNIARSLLTNISTPKEKIEAMTQHSDPYIASGAKLRLEKMK